MSYPAFDQNFGQARSAEQQRRYNEALKLQNEVLDQYARQQREALRQQDAQLRAEAYRRMFEHPYGKLPQRPTIVSENHWSIVLGVKPDATTAEIKTAYRLRAKSAHSDAGGSDAAMSRLNVARDQALKERHD
jgi:hypothetical protein